MNNIYGNGAKKNPDAVFLVSTDFLQKEEPKNIMYDLTYEDFCRIREEAFHPEGESPYAVTFEVMEKMFPGFLYARRSTFPCEEDLEDCLSAAEIRIIERIRRYYFEREDMEKTPETLQRWMFAVLKNCHYTALRQTEGGRGMLQKMQQKAAVEMGMTYADGKINVGESEEIGTDGGFAEIYRRETEEEQKALLAQCFSEIFRCKSDLQIILAWLTVGALMLVDEMPKKDAIALISDADPTMEQVFALLRRRLSTLEWMGLTEEDWDVLARRTDEIKNKRFSDFTNQSVRSYISKSINKRNGRLAETHAPTRDFEF